MDSSKLGGIEVGLLVADAYVLGIYGSWTDQWLIPLILEERLEALRVAFAEGPHEARFRGAAMIVGRVACR